MKPLDLLKENVPPHILLYGAVGSGKTALVAQAYKSMLLDLDNGMRTAATLEDAFTKYRHQIEFEQFFDKKLRTATAYIQTKKKIIEYVNAIYAGKAGKEGVIIDSLTSLCKACELSVLVASNHTKLTQPDWGIVVDEIEGLIRILMTLPALVIVTAHEEIYTHGEVSKGRPYVSGRRLPNFLPALFDEVLYCDVRKVGADVYEYYVTGQKTSVITASTRCGLTERLVHATRPAKETDCGLKGVFERMKYEYF